MLQDSCRHVSIRKQSLFIRVKDRGPAKFSSVCSPLSLSHLSHLRIARRQRDICVDVIREPGGGRWLRPRRMDGEGLIPREGRAAGAAGAGLKNGGDPTSQPTNQQTNQPAIAPTRRNERTASLRHLFIFMSYASIEIATASPRANSTCGRRYIIVIDLSSLICHRKCRTRTGRCS